MRPPLVACLVILLLSAAAAPPAGGICVPRKPGAGGKVGPLPSPAKPTPPQSKPTSPKATPVAPGGDIVKALCAKTDYPDVCVAAIGKQPPPAGKKLDGPGVLEMAMAAVRAKAAEAKKAAEALIADPKTPKLAVGPLRDCADSYDDIPYSLDHAAKAIAATDKDTTGTMLDTCRTDVDTCDQGFEDREELPRLMSKYDSELAKLASNCLAIGQAVGLHPGQS